MIFVIAVECVGMGIFYFVIYVFIYFSFVYFITYLDRMKFSVLHSLCIYFTTEPNAQYYGVIHSFIDSFGT